MIGAVRATEDDADAGLETRDVAFGDHDSVRESVEAHLKVLAELAAPIVAVEGAEGICLRLGRVVEEGAGRFPELLAGLEVPRAFSTQSRSCARGYSSRWRSA